mmetsp:Transcript_56251/g.150576  ORF Transcript_56251/g.150576 Transcript_56251/m.150576 type:complete len:211 (+) Transcript_56251:1702-2334(+)
MMTSRMRSSSPAKTSMSLSCFSTLSMALRTQYKRSDSSWTATFNRRTMRRTRPHEPKPKHSHQEFLRCSLIPCILACTSRRSRTSLSVSKALVFGAQYDSTACDQSKPSSVTVSKEPWQALPNAQSGKGKRVAVTARPLPEMAASRAVTSAVPDCTPNLSLKTSERSGSKNAIQNQTKFMSAKIFVLSSMFSQRITTIKTTPLSTPTQKT